jgi:Co/Zn/Cd efflux system component
MTSLAFSYFALFVVFVAIGAAVGYMLRSMALEAHARAMQDDITHFKRTMAYRRTGAANLFPGGEA